MKYPFSLDENFLDARESTPSPTEDQLDVQLGRWLELGNEATGAVMVDTRKQKDHVVDAAVHYIVQLDSRFHPLSFPSSSAFN